MSDTFTNDDEQELPEAAGFRDEVRKARQTERENADLKARLEASERESAGIKAGLPDTPAVKFFLENRKGPNDPDSIRREAEELGFLTPPPPAADPQVEAELEALRQGSGAVRGSGSDPEPEALEAYYDKLDQAKRQFAERTPNDSAQQAGKRAVIQIVEDAQKAGIDVHLVDGARG